MIILLPIFGTAWAASDLSAIPSPGISISPTSGPPGTKITITVSDIPDISKETYPYPDLYIYLPFSQQFGVTPQSQCGGEDCFPIYTHGEAVNQDLADRTITFSLFSTANPNPVYLDGFENSICDVTVNGKTAERYSSLCNTKDQPPGTYEITFGWAEENAPQIKHVVKTVQFTVTPGYAQPVPQKTDNGNSIIEAYQNGEISESAFYSKLSTLGWSSSEIRQALATIGKLPHQTGAPVPDEMQQIQEGVQKESQQFNSPPVDQPPQITQGQQTTQQPAAEPVQQTRPVTGEQTAESLTPYKLSSSQQQPPKTVQTQGGSDSGSQNDTWNIITIGASVGAASAIGGSIFVARYTRKVTN